MASDKQVKFKDMVRTAKLAAGPLDNMRYYGLTGERREAARHQYRVRLVVLLGILLAVGLFVVVGSLLSPQIINERWFPLVIYGAGLVASIGAGLYALGKRETVWQLWFKQRGAIKQQEADNLRDVEEFMTKAQQGKDPRGQ